MINKQLREIVEGDVLLAVNYHSATREYKAGLRVIVGVAWDTVFAYEPATQLVHTWPYHTDNGDSFRVLEPAIAKLVLGIS